VWILRFAGFEFARIYWTDSERVEQNLEKIFSKDLWDETWGTYVSWRSPSPKRFELLVWEGQYLKAMEKIGCENKFKFGKAPDEGLVEHLMIGYFNGWMEYDSEELRRFFKKAPAELRGKAARDENMRRPWSGIQEPLVSFLERIVGMGGKVQDLAIEVVDLYGRYNPDAFRGVWERLKGD